MPTPEEWVILHQTELALETMAYFQEVLEGEKYVTSSLVPIAVFQVRNKFLAVCQSQETMEPVRELCTKLLDDFDKRYVPTSDDSGSKLRFSWGVSIGNRNRYNTIHHFFFVAAFLDPRVKKILRRKMMTHVDYQALKLQVRKLMEAEEKKRREAEGRSDDGDVLELANPSAQEGRTAADDAPTASSAKTATMYEGLIPGPDDEDSDDEDEEAGAGTERSVRDVAIEELDKFERVSLSLTNPDGSYVNPLPWWKENSHRFPLLAKLAQVYLAIPATSAPSERVWSRAARILTCKRSKLQPEVAQGMMYLMENSYLLRKHYPMLAKKHRKDGFLHLIPFELELLPGADDSDVGSGEAVLDVGQHDSSSAAVLN